MSCADVIRTLVDARDTIGVLPVLARGCECVRGKWAETSLRHGVVQWCAIPRSGIRVPKGWICTASTGDILHIQANPQEAEPEGS